MEIFDTAGPEAPGNEKQINSRIVKSALKFFGAGATVVFLLAMYYCFTTGHRTEMSLLAVGYTALLFFATRIYKGS